MPKHALLRPLLKETGSDEATADDRAGVIRALAIDPALHGRASCDEEGFVVLTASDDRTRGRSKERRRWELHVRLRLTAELGDDVANSISIRWSDAPKQ